MRIHVQSKISVLIQIILTRVAGAGVFGWSQSRNFLPAPAPTPTLQYFKYLVFTGPKYDYKYDYKQCCGAGAGLFSWSR